MIDPAYQLMFMFKKVKGLSTGLQGDNKSNMHRRKYTMQIDTALSLVTLLFNLSTVD